MDDRFDRRELLLHLGDILDALNCLARTNEPGALVAHLMQGNDSLQDFEFLRTLAPEMTVAEFIKGAASAFFPWPAELLEAELNRDGLASTVQHNLFGGNPDGWNAYISGVQKKVKWFGAGLANMNKNAPAEASRDVTDAATLVEAPVMGVATVDVLNEKRGWPWPEPRSTS
ncbi:hypothetical protein RI103_22055 [Paraburkholderia sp. FT54]|uniref:hypothetical protein n=1 Tax=Paraburkholderia sp. FT54 TaxID=3074437 RepID=UPI002877D4FA|nr:hypothetical protein [Paraburkholderia sp. FT54]WNC93488.1 hypothetical protein RI103_22055 [Paraburkholderia sp. FT54]